MALGMVHSSRFQHHNTCNLINPLDEPEGQLAVAILSNVFGGRPTMSTANRPGCARESFFRETWPSSRRLCDGSGPGDRCAVAVVLIRTAGPRGCPRPTPH